MARLLTHQEIFNTVATHLLKQNAQCGDQIGCRYYDPKTGHKCAVGCLIPPARYDGHLEGHSIESIISVLHGLYKGEDQLDADQQELLAILGDVGVDTTDLNTLKLLHELQQIHDNTKVADWKLELTELAEHRDLNMPAV